MLTNADISYAKKPRAETLATQVAAICDATAVARVDVRSQRDVGGTLIGGGELAYLRALRPDSMAKLNPPRINGANIGVAIDLAVS